MLLSKRVNANVNRTHIKLVIYGIHVSANSDFFAVKHICRHGVTIIYLEQHANRKN